MKLAIAAGVAATAAAYENPLDGVAIFSRHGARTHLADWTEKDDFKFHTELGGLTAAGYSQAMQTGTNFYYKYKNYFGKEVFGKSKKLKVISSGVQRSWDTAVGFMEGWNLVVEKTDEYITQDSVHFSSGALPRKAFNAAEALRNLPVDRSDLMRSNLPRIYAQCNRSFNESPYFKEWIAAHQAEIEELIPFMHLSESRHCLSDGICKAEDMTVDLLGEFVSTFVSTNFHDAHSDKFEFIEALTPSTAAFLKSAFALELGGWYFGRAASLSAAYVMDEVLSSLHAHKQSGLPGPALELMTSHDSVITGFMMGLGLTMDQLPSFFYNDAVAIEVVLPSHHHHKPQPHHKHHHKPGCVRFLYNGIQPLPVSQNVGGIFPPCTNTELKGQGWVDLSALYDWAQEIINTPELDDTFPLYPRGEEPSKEGKQIRM